MVASMLLLITAFSLCIVFVVVASQSTLKKSYVKTKQSYKKSPPNILEILVDDLGYGDTSLSPFVGLEVSTPNLEKMATKGMILTNYHTAAATCTPTRASIMTGMYPWRMGIKAVFEYGGSHTNRNDWLPPLPTIPMVLREANYSVSHSGKWHLGGMRNDDWDLRQLPEKPPGQKGGKRCPHPGPNQQGFKNYVSMLDGPGSHRQNRLQTPSKLYSLGCTALLHNDKDISKGEHNITGYLSFCEAEHAIYAMTRSVAKQKPFFVQLWFHAPHAPYEGIPGYPEYQKKEVRIGANRPDGTFPVRVDNVPLDDMGIRYKYRSMIADMDHQVGRILTHIESLGIEENTLIVFTSDNGPENAAGSTAGLKGRKRSLYEGGIRVPAIMQWVGTIPAGQTSDMFAVSTDLFPTFLDAAGVRAPAHLHLDGLSLLPRLISTYYTDSRTAPLASAGAVNLVDKTKDDSTLYDVAMRDRVTLWHNDYEGPRRTAAWVYDFKVILDEKDRMREMYDMRADRSENANLLDTKRGFNDDFWMALNASFHKPGLSAKQQMAPLEKELTQKVTLKMIENDRGNRNVHLYVAGRLYKLLQDFARGGNQAHSIYMAANPGWRYPSTVISAHRSEYIPQQLSALVRGSGAAKLHQELVDSSCGTTACTCEVKLARDVHSLPFAEAGPYAYLSPGELLNGANLFAF